MSIDTTGSSSIPLSPLTAMSQATAMNSVVLGMGCACFVVGVPTSVLLLWLIYHRSSKEMKPYARILTQVAVLDIAHLTAFFLMNPVFVVNDGVSVLYGIGVATADGTHSRVNRLWNYSLMLFWLMVACRVHNPSSVLLSTLRSEESSRGGWCEVNKI